MKHFKRPSSHSQNAGKTTIDFGAAVSRLPKVFEPEIYSLKIQAAQVRQSGENLLVALDIIESGTGSRVDMRPIWVDGPNASVGDLAVRNQHLVGRLLAAAGQPTKGDVGVLIPKLAGLSFEGRLVLAVDSRTGRTFNELAEIMEGGAQ